MKIQEIARVTFNPIVWEFRTPTAGGGNTAIWQGEIVPCDPFADMRPDGEKVFCSACQDWHRADKITPIGTVDPDGPQDMF